MSNAAALPDRLEIRDNREAFVLGDERGAVRDGRGCDEPVCWVTRRNDVGSGQRSYRGSDGQDGEASCRYQRRKEIR
jgi:hypothetical protein